MNQAVINLPVFNLIFTVMLAVIFGLATLQLFTMLKKKYHQQKSLVDRINKLLPQTQCGQCGYAGCRPYARAITQGEAINRCPPGGSHTIISLANLLNKTPEPLDPANGQIKAFSVAVIREDECIGCTKCIVACPVDAILGGPKVMHTVIESQCTGCDLCVEPCPVDCIDMIELTASQRPHWRTPQYIANPLRDLEARQ